MYLAQFLALSFFMSVALCMPASIFLNEATKYSEWKKKKIDFLRDSGCLTKLKEIEHLIWHTQNALNETRDSLRTHYQEEALYNYNYLRELLELDPVRSQEEIDHAWLDHLDEETTIRIAVQKFDLLPPTEDQKILVAKAKKKANLKKLFALSSRSELYGYSQPTFIALGKNPDSDTQYATLYHELGHIVHNDHECQKHISDGKKSVFDTLNDPLFKSDLKRIERAIKQGALVLNLTTKIGRQIDSFRAYKKLSIPPKQEAKRPMWLYLRALEQRADLYATEELFKEGRLSVLLRQLEYYVFPEDTPIPFVVAYGDSTFYPSDIERALFIAGFLAEQGIAVNQLIRTWQTHGKCFSSREFHLLEEQGVHVNQLMVGPIREKCFLLEKFHFFEESQQPPL